MRVLLAAVDREAKKQNRSNQDKRKYDRYDPDDEDDEPNSFEEMGRVSKDDLAKCLAGLISDIPAERYILAMLDDVELYADSSQARPIGEASLKERIRQEVDQLKPGRSSQVNGRIQRRMSIESSWLVQEREGAARIGVFQGFGCSTKGVQDQQEMGTVVRQLRRVSQAFRICIGLRS